MRSRGSGNDRCAAPTRRWEAGPPGTILLGQSSAAAVVPLCGFAYEEGLRSRGCSEERMTVAEPTPKPVTACVLIIGNEILSGRTQDANLAFLAQGLNEVGIRLREARVIPDDAKAIVATVNEARRTFDYVFTTGGIGPTHDDITSACIPEAFRAPPTLHPGARRILETPFAPGAANQA